MTGYGKSSVSLSGKKFNIEIKTLNSKQLDLSLKLHPLIKETEPLIRNMVSQRLERGKVEIAVSIDSENEVFTGSINRKLVQVYRDEILSVCRTTGIPEPQDILALIMRIPDVITSSQDSVSGEDTGLLMDGIAATLDQVRDFRTNEGKILEKDILLHIHSILEALDAITPHEKQRIISIREKMLKEFEKYTEINPGISVDRNRFEQELIFYLEKLDINEEKVRLWKHCAYFLETLKEEGTHGKKLGFIAQEMGREINTIGSKANDADIQRIVVQMKDELEKVKEQLGNVL